MRANASKCEQKLTGRKANDIDGASRGGITEIVCYPPNDFPRHRTRSRRVISEQSRRNDRLFRRITDVRAQTYKGLIVVASVAFSQKPILVFLPHPFKLKAVWFGCFE